MAITDRRGATVSATDAPASSTPNADLAIKTAVRCVATSAINIQTFGLGVIDGVALAAGDRVLLTGQTDSTQNGIYNASTGVWAMSSDFQDNTRVASGVQVFVVSGTTNGLSQWVLVTADPIVLGTTALSFRRSLNRVTAIYANTYGVQADGVTDDSAAWGLAIDAANARGNVAIIAPEGTSRAPTLAKTVSGTNVWIISEGGVGASLLKLGANNALNWTGYAGGLIGMGLDNTGPSTNTTINVKAANLTLLDVVLGSGIGVFVNYDIGAAGVTVHNLTNYNGGVGNPNQPLFILNNGALFSLYDANLYSGVAPGAGVRGLIFISGNSFDSIILRDNFIQEFGYAINGTALNGAVPSNVFADGNVWDGMTNGYVFAANAGGTWLRIDIRDPWISTLGGPAISFSGAGTFDNIYINTKIVLAGTSGIISTVSGIFKNVKIANCTLTGLNFTNAAGTADGINLAGGAGYSNISITGCSVGAISQSGSQPKNGCFIGGVIDHFLFASNDCQGTVANYDGMLAGTTTVYAHTNSRQIGNVGLPDSKIKVSASATDAFLVTAADGLSNGFAISGTNSIDNTRPSARSDGSNLVLNPASNGFLFLAFDAGLGLATKLIVAPSAPPAGALYFYADSTDLRFHDKNPVGTIGTTVVASSASAHQFATAVSASGVVSYAQPVVGDIGSVAASSLIGNPTGAPANASAITLGSSLVFSGTSLVRAALTGDVTAAQDGNATTIAANAVTYAKFQQVAASSLVGNPTGSLANAQGITLGATLAFSGSALQTAAQTGDVTTSANSFATTVAKIQGTTVSGTTGSGNVVFSSSPTIATPTITTSAVIPLIGPPSNSTTAVKVTKADLSTAVMTFDTTNARVGINKTPGAFDLDVNGAANVGGVLTHANGSAGSPSIAFGSDTGTGLWRVGASTIGFSLGGTEKGQWNTNALVVEGTSLYSYNGISISDGSAVGTYPAGLLTQVNGSLIQFGVNDAQIQSSGAPAYDSTKQGAFFRLDSRAGQHLFQMWLRAASSLTPGTEQLWASSSGDFNFTANIAATSTTSGTVKVTGGLGVSGAIYAGNEIKSVSATAGVGYATGAGGAVTQGTSRTTGVTLNAVSGDITLVSAAGSASFQTFTVTNSAVAATDTVNVVQKSGTDLYQIFVTNVAAGSFKITFATTGGTTTEQPVFHFNVIKGVSS